MDKGVIKQFSQLNMQCRQRILPLYRDRVVTDEMNDLVREQLQNSIEILRHLLGRRPLNCSTLLAMTYEELCEADFVDKYIIVKDGGQIACKFGQLNGKVNTQIVKDGLVYYEIVFNAHEDVISGLIYLYQANRLPQFETFEALLHYLRKLDPSCNEQYAKIAWAARNNPTIYSSFFKFRGNPNRLRMCNYCKSIGLGYKVCSNCKVVHYCGPACQRKDWPVHKCFANS